MADLNTMAITLKSLHKPGSPIVFANVYDALTARAVGELPNCSALATASYAIAQAAGMEDDDLDLPTNIAAVRAIGSVARKLGRPLSADMQDGYGNKLDEAIRQVIDAGAVGINLEDFDKDSQEMIAPDIAAQRVARTLSIATDKGVQDFVVNARCDCLLHGGKLEEVIQRGHMYLKAGATCVFVWGGSARGGISREEVMQLSEAFQGRLNVSMKLPVGAGLDVSELTKIGVCRISVGPKLVAPAMETYAREAAKFLK